jgi:hypothetical protein
MFELTPFVQDVIATSLAAGAFGILVHRTVGVLRPAAGEPPCTACGACPKPPDVDPGQTATVVPLNNLRRHRSSSEQPSRRIRHIG